MVSRLFIARPILAAALAIVVTLVGLASLCGLGIARYPDVAPPAVTVTARYPGASAETVQTTVTDIIERQLNGLPDLLYFSSNSGSNGEADVTATFRPGAAIEAAQTLVQNRVQSATPLLPPAVQQQGVLVAKALTNRLLALVLYDETGRMSTNDIADFIDDNLKGPLSQTPGVGAVGAFGARHAIRIWLDPDKLRRAGLMPSDVRSAVMAQNNQVPAGQIGAQPAASDQELTATVTAQSRLQTPAEFGAIILRGKSDGSAVRLRDVSRVELGSQSYDLVGRMNGLPAAGLNIYLAPGANALMTASLIKARAAALIPRLPPGVRLSYPLDATGVVKLSIRHVVEALIEAVVLVVVVMFLFLRDIRATLIPALAIPVVLAGTCAALLALGYSLNILTLFAMVLVIGLLVDDAIVVVENVERIMAANGLSPREATVLSMREITGALIGIAIVLAAVLGPLALFPGGAGVIYRQFAVTMVVAIVLSALVALTLTPALCAVVLTRKERNSAEDPTPPSRFGVALASLRVRLEQGLLGLVGRPWIAAVLYTGLVIAVLVSVTRLPTGFLPPEDEGAIAAILIGPPGSTLDHTVKSLTSLETYFRDKEHDTIQDVFSVAGVSLGGADQNVGAVSILLKDWSLRHGARASAGAIAARAQNAFSQLPDALAFAIVAPVIPELGASSGFDLELENRAGLSRADFVAARNRLIAAAAADPALIGVRVVNPDDAEELHVAIDDEKAAALGLQPLDVASTLSAAWSPTYLDDFIDHGRVKSVLMEGDAPFRSVPEDLNRWTVRGAGGEMTPFSAFARTEWRSGPSQLHGFDGYPSFEIQGAAAPGRSSGEAMAEVQKLASRLPIGVGYDWTGLSAQELQSGALAPLLYAASAVLVFVTLAAAYESWSLPLVVLGVFPLGLLGAAIAATLRGLNNDIYFQVGLLTTMGLAAKNAILMVEFALQSEARGTAALEAIIEAAMTRLRPILMTSLAFGAGVLPLMVASGAGAGSEIAIGTSVVGGMASATVLTLAFVPFLYVLVRRAFPARRPKDDPLADLIRPEAAL